MPKTLKNKRIFVSGGAGVIGHEIVPKLLAQGANVFVGDLKSCPSEWQGQVRYRQGDLNFLESSEIEDFAPEIFIHLAATFERSTESYEFWKENFWHNVHLSNHLMTLMKDLPSLRKVIFASSYLIYDPNLYNFETAQSKPISLSENNPIYPRNLTGMAKLAHEIELRFINSFHSKQYKIVVARIFRGYGRGSRDVISRWIRSLLNNEEITVFNKEGWFDYIYAADTAEGLIRLVASDKADGIINLGTGKAKQVANVIDTLKKHFPKIKTSEKNSDIPYEASQADITKLISLTNWSPEYDIEKAIPEMINFEKNKKTEPKNTFFGNILVSSSANKVPLINTVKLAAAKLSPDIKVFAGDINNNVATSFVADKFWKMPRTEEQNLDIILKWCIKNNIRYIIPTRDGELMFWAKNKKKFSSKGINIMISNEDAVRKSLDKLEFSQYCIAENIPAIPAYKTLGEFKSNKYVVKERRGAGSKSIGINMNLAEVRKHALNLDEPIFQPFFKGSEISADAYIDKHGNIHGLILRRRDKIINGESQITTTITNKKVEKVLLKAIQKLELYGHIILQALIGENDKVSIIECNCRFGGASTLSIKAGLDSFYWFLIESNGQDLKNYPFIPSKKQIKQIRTNQDQYIYGINI